MQEILEKSATSTRDRLPTTAIIMATYNGAAFVAEQLASFARQTMLPGELIISDDGSTDDTVSIVREFARTAPFPVDIIVNERNLGYSKNFIATARRSKAELLFFSDQDDIWTEDKIERLTHLSAKSSELVITHNKSLYYPHDGASDQLSFYQFIQSRGFPPAIAMAGCCMAVKSAFFDRWGWPAESSTISHDCWIAVLATAFNERKYVEQPLIRYRIHGANTSGWIPSHKDLVRTSPDKLGTSGALTDLELMIEVFIKPWNLSWTNDFIKIAQQRSRPQDQALLSTFVSALKNNAAWYAQRGIRPPSSAQNFLRRSKQIARKIIKGAISR